MNAIGTNQSDWHKHFKLIADIDLVGYPGRSFNLIGTVFGPAFSGVFDGNGHTISKFSYTSIDTFFIAMFRSVGGENAEIRDLVLKNPNIDGSASYTVAPLVGSLRLGSTVSGCSVEGGSVAGRQFVGGIVGQSRGTVVDCKSSADVSGVHATSTAIGGLVGLNNTDGLIAYCSSAGMVSVTVALSPYGDVGGLVGDNDEASIIHCHSASRVLGGCSSLGGLVGANGGGTIANSYTTGSVEGGNMAGGLLGGNGGTVDNCYSRASVSGTSDVGGLVGGNGVTITNCYSSGSVSGDSDVGGLLGSNTGQVYSSFWDTNTSGLANMCGTQEYGGTGCDNANGKTTAQMQTKTTFTDAGWDFVGESVNGPNDLWAIHEDQDYSRLVWELVNFVGWYEVDFFDYAFFANYFQDTNCGDANDCEGADLDFSDKVDWADAKIFCHHWLEGAEN
jgi:hypothetical protein